MKKCIFLLFFLLPGSSLFAQHSMADLFSGKAKVVFLGVDFTHAHYVGKAGFTDPSAIKNQHINSWNTLIEAEPKKFSLEKPLKLKSDQYESDVADMVNLNKKSAEVEGHISEEAKAITEAQVKQYVSQYNLSEKSGIGVVYIAENLNKNEERMTAWVTFIDLSTKNVLHTELMEGKAGGFGFRNYWAGAIYNINKQVGSNYKKWSKQMM
ncbi:hypothetical protein [Dyadobacter tibetensis]|uniref:hypothetical protein n=1 Tax=Dyadobacter tibetensis TaxID=1211851 RepID=UPI00046EE54F|nr:hypothetical protein [Dyadobacter tibetensis]